MFHFKILLKWLVAVVVSLGVHIFLMGLCQFVGKRTALISTPFLEIPSTTISVGDIDNTLEVSLVPAVASDNSESGLNNDSPSTVNSSVKTQPVHQFPSELLTDQSPEKFLTSEPLTETDLETTELSEVKPIASFETKSIDEDKTIPSLEVQSLQNNTSMESANITTPPVLAEKIKLVYPQRAREKGVEGEVMVEIQISAKGKVVQVKVAKSSGSLILDNAALSTAKKLHFKPAQKNGENIATTQFLPLRYRLKN